MSVATGSTCGGAGGGTGAPRSPSSEWLGGRRGQPVLQASMHLCRLVRVQARPTDGKRLGASEHCAGAAPLIYGWSQ